MANIAQEQKLAAEQEQKQTRQEQRKQLEHMLQELEKTCAQENETFFQEMDQTIEQAGFLIGNSVPDREYFFEQIHLYVQGDDEDQDVILEHSYILFKMVRSFRNQKIKLDRKWKHERERLHNLMSA